MELQTAIEILEYHQEWRLGKREDMIHEPKKLTQALDILLNGFNNGRDKSDGVGGEPNQFVMPIKNTVKDEKEILLNSFAVEFYRHLRPSKLMTTNDIAQFVTDFLKTAK